jgi:hypothetical protein
MALPIRATLDDIAQTCAYLASKPTRATLKDISSVVGEKLADARRISALQTWASLLRLQAQDKTQAVLNVSERLAPEPASWFGEEVPVECDQLRDVGDRVFRQSRGFSRKEDIAGGVQQAQVGSENHGYDGSDSASIEGVVLHNQKRAPKTRFGPTRLVEIGPPHLSALDYHVSGSSERRWARRRAGSRRPASAA